MRLVRGAQRGLSKSKQNERTDTGKGGQIKKTTEEGGGRKTKERKQERSSKEEEDGWLSTL
jgi:hypothetical protein